MRDAKYVLFENGFSYVHPPHQASFGEDGWQFRDQILTNGTKLRQGYLPVSIARELSDMVGLELHFDPIEARLRSKGDSYYSLSFKSDTDTSPEVALTQAAFELYWPYAKRRVEKVRLDMGAGANLRSYDAFMDRDLILVEEKGGHIHPMGKDVTHDKKYRNIGLARNHFHKKFILTGGPCSGKSSTLEYIQKMQYPIVEESARMVIEDQQQKGGKILPWENFLAFQFEVLNTSIRTENALNEQGTIFLDRGIPDAVSYCALAKIEPPRPLKDAIQRQNYEGVFILDPLPYIKDGQRKESQQEALQIHKDLIHMYAALGFQPISVPVNTELSYQESVKERAHFVVQNSYQF